MLTHCNTGSLATARYGTALGVIRYLHSQGKLERAYCTETRPYNQGCRLTAFELVTPSTSIYLCLLYGCLANFFSPCTSLAGVVHCGELKELVFHLSLVLPCGVFNSDVSVLWQHSCAMFSVDFLQILGVV